MNPTMPTSATAAARRPPASESRQTHRGRTIPTDGSPSLERRVWWLARMTSFVCLYVADLTEPESSQEVLRSWGRVRKVRLPQLGLFATEPPGFGPHRKRVCRRTRQDSILRAVDRAPRIPPRCMRSCGPCVCSKVGSMPGAGGSARVRSTISPPVRTSTVSTDAARGPAIENMVTSPHTV